ncbi:ATP-dependent helicase C-terminal domain-containing protein, partial [Rhodovulum imhoffii]
YRLWTRGAEGALASYPPAEIEAADLSALALELALWGAEPQDLAFLTPPNPGPFAEARALLGQLGALDEQGRITAHGRDLAALPVHPRLGHMLIRAGKQAAPLAALLSDRDPLRGTGSDLTPRLRALQDPQGAPPAARPGLARIRAEAGRLARAASDAPPVSAAEAAALAYPDRIALRRPGEAPRYVLSGGKGAILEEGDPLAGQRLLVALDLDGDAREARIRLAAPLAESELRAVHANLIGWHDLCHWSRRERRVLARRQEHLGALVLEDRIWKDAPPEAIAHAMLDGVRDLGLPWNEAARRFRARVNLVRRNGADLPEMTDPALMESLEAWLLPHLTGIRTAADWKRFDLLPALRAMLDWPQTQTLDSAAPAWFLSPLGRKVPIDYSGATPEIALRLQEMFGQTTHPTVAGVPLRVTLLSPAGRPVQVTMDLPGFWANSYADVRKDMRGQYPRHPWPEDPTQATPTLRAKPRR